MRTQLEKESKNLGDGKKIFSWFYWMIVQSEIWYTCVSRVLRGHGLHALILRQTQQNGLCAVPLLFLRGLDIAIAAIA